MLSTLVRRRLKSIPNPRKQSWVQCWNICTTSSLCRWSGNWQCRWLVSKSWNGHNPSWLPARWSLWFLWWSHPPDNLEYNPPPTSITHLHCITEEGMLNILVSSLVSAITCICYALCTVHIKHSVKCHVVSSSFSSTVHLHTGGWLEKSIGSANFAHWWGKSGRWMSGSVLCRVECSD